VFSLPGGTRRRPDRKLVSRVFQQLRGYGAQNGSTTGRKTNTRSLVQQSALVGRQSLRRARRPARPTWSESSQAPPEARMDSGRDRREGIDRSFQADVERGKRNISILNRSSSPKGWGSHCRECCRGCSRSPPVRDATTINDRAVFPLNVEGFLPPSYFDRSRGVRSLAANLHNDRCRVLPINREPLHADFTQPRETEVQEPTQERAPLPNAG
jgi:hypothetical protein